MEPGSAWYAGVTVLALALVAPLVARRCFAIPYFAVLSPCALVLSYPGTTPLHAALYLLPLFERLHPHRPERVMVVFYLGAALLAGAALTALGEKAIRSLLPLVPPILAALLLASASVLTSWDEVPEGADGGWKELFWLV